MPDKYKFAKILDIGIKVIIGLILILSVSYIAFIKFPKSSVKGKEAAESITAEFIYKAFLADEQQAEQKYLGQVLELSGTIQELYTDEQNAPVLILGDANGSPIVLITLERSEFKKSESLQEGNLVKVKALCTGMLMEVTFNKGLILNP